MSNILIADDNKQIREILTQYANDEGYTVFQANDGIEAISLFEKNNFEIILLDVMMPKKDGFEVCRYIRRTSNIPIIMITARGEDFERIMGLDIGADDYIVKPFSPGEVMARIRAILRRIENEDKGKEQIKKFNDLVVDLDKFIVTISGERINLTKKEIEILWVLMEYPSKVFTRDNLLDKVWGYEYYGESRTVDSHIKRLRTKLSVKEHPTWEIKTVWGVGYKFEVLENEV